MEAMRGQAGIGRRAAWRASVGQWLRVAEGTRSPAIQCLLLLPRGLQPPTCYALRCGLREQPAAVFLHQLTRVGLMLGAVQRRQREVAPLQRPCRHSSVQRIASWWTAST